MANLNLYGKQTDSVWIIEDNSTPFIHGDVRDYFYPTRAAAIDAFWVEFGQINSEVTFRELKRVGSSTPPLDGPVVRTADVHNQTFYMTGQKHAE